MPYCGEVHHVGCIRCLTRDRRKECAEENPPTLVHLLREICFCVCIRKGKASVQDEKSLRKEINIPVQLDRKAKTDCRKKVRSGRRVFEYLVPETKKHKRDQMSVLVIRHILIEYWLVMKNKSSK